MASPDAEISVPVDYERLLQLRRFEDSKAGITEEFLALDGVPAGTLPILAAPRTESRSIGWVLCRSIGQEQRNLRRLEALVARELAASGFPTLRLRSNPEAGAEARDELVLEPRLAEVEAAIELLRAETGVDSIGLAGALFGGTVAGLVAARLHLPLLAMWEPVLQGKRYMRESFRLQRLSELVGMTGGAASAEQSQAELDTRGWTTIRGFRVDKAAYDEAAAIDLAEGVRGFAGDALVAVVSRSGQASRGAQSLVDGLRASGANPTLAALQDELETPFGEYYYRDAGTGRADTRLRVDQELTRITTDWATAAAGAEKVA